MDFGRLITAMVTPFDQNGEINWDETARLIEHLIVEQKSDSLVIAGTTGESPTLREDEKLELFKFAVKQADGRSKIIAGTGGNDTAHSAELTKKRKVAASTVFCLSLRIIISRTRKGSTSTLRRSLRQLPCLSCCITYRGGRASA